MSALYRLVYASKNLLKGTEAEMMAEVQRILAASQRNNQGAGVTGALMFNGGAFAQVLEGPQRGVEETFERIQRDARHGEVTVLECGPAAERSFTAWSMAFVGQSARGLALWSGLAAESGFDHASLDGDAVFAMLHGLVLEEEGIPAASPPPAPTPVREDAARTMDAGQVRAEIATLRPVAAAGAGDAGRAEGGAGPALAILKAALADERARTSDLRDTVDELRVALAETVADRDRAYTERDLWIRRARALAAPLFETPQTGRGRDLDAPHAVGRETRGGEAAKRAAG